MEARIQIKQVEPDAYTAMFGLEKYINSAALNPRLRELIKIRASQINGCAYCIQMHTEQARQSGETEQRIYALSAWRESPLFNETESAVLAVTEDITRIADKGLSKAVYDEALALLGEQGIAQCIMQVVTINAWNRIAAATKMKHAQ